MMHQTERYLDGAADSPTEAIKDFLCLDFFFFFFGVWFGLAPKRLRIKAVSVLPGPRLRPAGGPGFPRAL